MRSKTMPAGEARPLGTNASKRNNKGRKPTAAETKRDYDVVAGKKIGKVVDNTPSADVDSLHSDAAMTLNSSETPATQEHTTMSTTITLTRDNKARKSTSVVYTSPSVKGGIRIAKSAFQDGVAPETFDIVSDSFAAPKPKETKEERKARLKNAPKLTLAEKIAKREKQLDALKAKAAAASAPAVETSADSAAL